MHITEILKAADLESSTGTPGINGSITISLGDDYHQVTLSQLQRISELLGTERVAVAYEKETGPWSDITPGDASSCRIIASEVSADVEFDQTVYLPTNGYVTGRIVMRGGVLTEDKSQKSP